MNPPLVTICIPTFNAEKTLLATLNSILAQKYPYIKLKIFDNRSTDKTVELAHEFASKFEARAERSIEIEINKSNLGGEGNFTKCIQAGEGQYTALLHSDDIYDSEYITTAIAHLEGSVQTAAFCCHANTIDGNALRTGERFIPSELKGEKAHILTQQDLLRLSFKYGNFITCPSIVARTDVYRNHIKVWNGQDFKSSADLDVWFRLSEMGTITFYPKPLVNYRVSEISYSYRLIRRRTYRHDLFLVLDHWLLQVPTELQDELKHSYNFLAYKDESLRSYNIIRNKANDPMPEYTLSFLETLKYAFLSRFHFKFFVLGNSIRLLRGLMFWRA